MSEFHLIRLQDEHLQQVREIYNFYVLNSTATFHINPLTINEIRELVCFNNPRYQTYVYCKETEVCGYILLTQHKKREAYDDTAEVTLYLKPGYTGKGLGSQALQFIESFARKNRFHVLLATIAGNNNQSIRLFEKNGYFKCAHFKEVGRKFGQFLDLVAYQKIL